jgi:serine/threonine protein kinase
MGDVEQFHLPPDARTYTLHPCLVHAVGGIQHVQEGSAGIGDAHRRTRPLPSTLRKPRLEAAGTAPLADGQAFQEPYPAQAPAKAPDYAVGDVIDSRFEVLQKLGHGGFSKVYRVHDDVENKERAFKLFDSAAGYEAVRREIGALREIHHPNVVEVFWAGQTSAGDWYLVTEFIEGESLEEFVTGKRILRDREAVDVALDLLDALVAFHPDAARLKQLDAERSDGNRPETESDEWTELTGRGLIHRDIKPRNIILARGGAKLLDFNIASRVGDPVHTQSGTPPYQPPDAGLTRWDVSTDLFAVGVLLYQLLGNGNHPYLNAMPIAGGVVTDPRTSRPDLGQDLAEFLIKACAPASTDRFATAAGMRLELRSIRAHL